VVSLFLFFGDDWLLTYALQLWNPYLPRLVKGTSLTGIKHFCDGLKLIILPLAEV
jgi:hypothetical protein